MTDRHDGGPAFPIKGRVAFDLELVQAEGMSLRQYAAIKLRVPDSGADWLDDMIRDARRMDYAGQALNKGVVNGDWCSTVEWRAKSAYEMADAMLAARSEAKP